MSADAGTAPILHALLIAEISMTSRDISESEKALTKRGSDMLIQGSLMHVNEALPSGHFLQFVAQEAPSAHYFVAQPPPGIIMTAAIDWRIIVSDAASIDALAAALWNGYESLVKPLHGDEIGRTPYIYVKMRNFRGEYDQFTIGKDIKKRETLAHRMRESAAILLPSNQAAAVLQELDKTSASDCWLKVS